jgi:hypothetical protein
MISNKRKEQPPTCNKCKSAIWKIQVSGVERKLSTVNLDLAGELRAKLARQQTFKIKKINGKLEGHYRDLYNIKAGRKPGDIIVTTHECGQDHAMIHPQYETRITYQIPEEPEY